MALNEKGHEVLDNTPVAKPVGWRPPLTMQEQIQRFVREELSRRAAEAGEESFEDADDFEVGDDYDPRSPYELDEGADQLPRWKEKDQRQAAVEDAESRIAERFKAKAAASRRAEEGGGEPPAGAVGRRRRRFEEELPRQRHRGRDVEEEDAQ